MIASSGIHRFGKTTTWSSSTGKDRGKRGPRAAGAARTRTGSIVEGVNFIKRHTRRTRSEHQGRHRRARGAAARVATCSWSARSAARRRASAAASRRRPQGAHLPQVRGSGRQMSRLKRTLQKEVVPALRKEFGYTNVMAVPEVKKVVVNMGLGEGTQNAKIVDTGADELGTDHRPEAGDHAARRSRSRSSSCARACRSARWSRCAASGCTSSSTG